MHDRDGVTEGDCDGSQGLRAMPPLHDLLLAASDSTVQPPPSIACTPAVDTFCPLGVGAGLDDVAAEGAE
ncbi:hypothetical protein ACWCQZ_42960 [Streptomyces sp. NPDC002285]